MTEQWRPVVSYEGLYEVSDSGQVRSVDRIDKLGRPVKGGVKAQRLNVAGYPVVRLWRDNKERTRPVHRLVGEAFLGPLPLGMETRHLDGNALNCVLSNLVYGTHSENVRDQLRHGTHATTNKTHCPKGHPYAGSNLFVNRRGGRMCRTCMWEQARDRNVIETR